MVKKTTDCAVFNYELDDSYLIEKISSFIQDNKDKVFSFFGINIDFNKPIINIINKKEKLDDIHRKFNDLEDTDEVPKWIVGFSSSDMQIYYLSINDYCNTSHAFKNEEYEVELDMYKKTILHEYIHYVNRLFCKKNNCSFSIKCLAEGVSQYLSDQKKDITLQFNYSLEDILNSNNCYNGWYLVTKYLIEKYPHELVLELLKDNKRAECFIKESYNKIKDYYLNLELKKYHSIGS